MSLRLIENVTRISLRTVQTKEARGDSYTIITGIGLVALCRDELSPMRKKYGDTLPSTWGKKLLLNWQTCLHEIATSPNTSEPKYKHIWMFIVLAVEVHVHRQPSAPVLTSVFTRLCSCNEMLHFFIPCRCESKLEQNVSFFILFGCKYKLVRMVIALSVRITCTGKCPHRS